MENNGDFLSFVPKKSEWMVEYKWVNAQVMKKGGVLLITVYIYINKYKFHLLKSLLVTNADDFLNTCNKGDLKFKDFNLHLLGEGGRGIIYGTWKDIVIEKLKVLEFCLLEWNLYKGFNFKM